MPRSRRGGRNSAVSRAERAIKNRDLRFRVHRPPVRQPTVNRTFRFPFTCYVGHTFSGGGTTSQTLEIRVEDVIKAAQSSVGLPANFASQITVSPQKVVVYGLIDAYDRSWSPVIEVQFYDPMTEGIVKCVAVEGDVDDPPRTGMDYPVVVSDHVFTWDGVATTSVTLLAVRTVADVYVATYITVVLTIARAGFVPVLGGDDHPIMTTGPNGLCPVVTREPREPNRSTIDLGNLRIVDDFLAVPKDVD